MVEQRNSVERYGGTMEQCGTVKHCGGTVWWKRGAVWTVWWNTERLEHYGGRVEQWNSVVEQCGTAWWNSVAQFGRTVSNDMVEQWNSVEQ